MRINSFLKQKETKKEVLYPKNKEEKKNKYTKAFEQILFFMLNNDWIITQVEKERIIFPNEVMRSTCNEIIYYYKKYGTINIADFYTYIQDKEDIMLLVNNILASKYNETTSQEELREYFNCVKEFTKKEEIKRLIGLMKKELDPLEQAKIADKIRKLRLGDI